MTSPFPQDTDLATEKTRSELIEGYQEIQRLVAEGYATLEKASGIFNELFAADPVRYPSHIANPDKSQEQLLREIKVKAWRSIVARSGFTRFASSKRKKEWEEKCEATLKYYHIPPQLPEKTRKEREAKILPELSDEAVALFMDAMLTGATQFAAETVKEVFDILTPGRGGYSQLKTNKGKAKTQIGEKVILTGVVDYSPHWTRINYWQENKLIQVDRLFHLLDGAGILDGYKSPLVDAISQLEIGKIGETDYFKFKFFGNGNLHLWFKRPDLVKEINRIAGGGNFIGGGP